MSKNQPSLPAHRAFVVQLHAEAQVAAGRFRGRVEHVTSGRATHFDSLEALVAFITQTVQAVDAEQG